MTNSNAMTKDQELITAIAKAQDDLRKEVKSLYNAIIPLLAKERMQGSKTAPTSPILQDRAIKPQEKRDTMSFLITFRDDLGSYFHKDNSMKFRTELAKQFNLELLSLLKEYRVVMLEGKYIDNSCG